MFTVYENNKRAQYPDIKVDSSWNNASFETREEAVQYAQNWLGIYAPHKDYWNERSTYPYNGFDVVHIKEEVKGENYGL